MILCVTPNPAVDRTLLVPQIRVGEVLRASQSIVAAGGKGLNVARVAHALGGAVTCAGFLGGHSGRIVAELAEREGLSSAWTWIDGETRTCVILAEAAGRDATVINAPGPTVTADDWRRMHAHVVDATGAADIVCLSGSLPPGSAARDYAGLLAALRQTNRPVWVDTSGAALAAALTVEGLAFKINADEARALIDSDIERPAQALLAARELHRRTGGPVVLTLGGAGAVLADTTGSWHAQPPVLQVISTAGSGDAFLAGLAVAHTHGAAPPEALRRAVAAGAANALSIGGGQIDLGQYDEILRQTTICRMP
jgi:1-phosphofructokinase family hexose kinase